MRRLDGGRALLLAALFGATVYWSHALFFPIQLFVTLIHEMCHGLAALATGGSILRIVVEPTLGGHCLTAGGWPVVIIPAGYLGSMGVGAGILWGASRTRHYRRLAGLLGAAMLGMTVLYVRSPVGVAGGAVYGTALLLSAWKLPDWFNDLLLSFLGVATLLYGLLDINILLNHPELSSRSDAYLFSKLIPLPPLLWALLWMLASLYVLYRVAGSALKAGPKARR